MKQNKIKISIVIPVYNVELFLDECINSVVNQTYKNIEIILVDDGSTDQCPVKCDEWAKRDNRIKVIHKKNAGLGEARNSGMNISTGDYICFVDSDDYIDKDTIEKIYNVLEEYDYDIIHYGFKYVDCDKNILNRYMPSPTCTKYKNEKVLKDFFPNLINLLPGEKKFNMNFSACMCAIKMKVIEKNKWKFVSERKIISEDIYSLSILYKSIKSVYILKEDLYSYRMVNSSLTHIYRDDRFKKVKIMYNELIKIYEEEFINERYRYLYLSYIIGCIKSIATSNIKYSKKRKLVLEISNDKQLKDILNNNKKETKSRKLFFWCLKNNMITLTLILAYFQSKKTIR